MLLHHMLEVVCVMLAVMTSSGQVHTQLTFPLIKPTYMHDVGESCMQMHSSCWPLVYSPKD